MSYVILGQVSASGIECVEEEHGERGTGQHGTRETASCPGGWAAGNGHGVHRG